MIMAKYDSKVSQLANDVKSTGLEVRSIGGRILLPGEYKFDADPEARFEDRTIQGSDRRYLQIEVKSSRGWVDLSLLMKRTKSTEGSLDYINPWIQGYADIAELAQALAGNTLIVSQNKVPVYTNYKDGQTIDEPRVIGSAYKASLIKATAPVAEAPAPAEAPAEANA